MDYQWKRCDCCIYTGYGDDAVNTMPHNTCENVACQEAYEAWKEIEPENAYWEE